MKRLTVLLFLLFVSTLTLSAKTEAILKLDTKGHTAIIGDIIVTKSGDIISASVDKTIRVWDSATGVEKRKILGEIGAGQEGMIYAMALSSNEEFLAVGGFLGIELGKIRIYNYQSGRLIKVLKSHTNVVIDLSFSSDGKYLISGSGDSTAKIWNSEKNFRLVDTISFHTNDVYAVKIIKSKSDYFAVTAGYDNQIAFYNMQTKEIVNSHKLGYKLSYLATSKENIAVCGFGKEIKIYDFNLNPIKTIISETKPQGLAYSPNGKFLIAGTYTSPNNVNIYSVNQNYKKIQSFKKHKNLTMAVAFLDNQTAVLGGGDNFEIYIWNIKSVNNFKKIEGIGDTILSVGVKGDIIAWGNKLKVINVNNRGELQKSINLKTFQISGHGGKSIFHRVSTTYKNYQLLHRRGGESNYAEGVLDIKRDGKRETSIIRNTTNGQRYNCYGFYKNYIVSGGTGGFLKIYNLKGREVANLVGHTGEVWSIAIDGDRLVSGSSDQTIRVWNLSKLKLKKFRLSNKILSIKKNSIASKYKLKVGDVIYSVDNKIFNSYEEYLEYTKPIGKYNFSIIRDNKKIEIRVNKTEKFFGLYSIDMSIQQMQPQLSLFISKNNEWIAWTPQGFYNASKGGEKYIGYHINQGSNKEAKFLDISRFKKQFYRPYLISKAIEGEDIGSYAKGIEIDSLLEAGLPPKVSFKGSSMTIDDETVTLGVDVCDEGGGSDNLSFYIDGKAIANIESSKIIKFTKKKVGNCRLIEREIVMPSGEHTIAFDATNKEGNIISNRSTMTVTNTLKVEKKPNLHILTLSVNDYKESAIKDLNFPNNDATALIAKFKEIGQSVFDKVIAYSLKDSQVTLGQIDAKVQEIAKKVKANDVFVLYVSGHGITNEADENYYFIPYDCPKPSKENLAKNAINQEHFKKIMSQIQTLKSAILLDTCQSGSMAKKLVDSTIERLGLNVGMAIIAGTSSTQDAIDGYKNHGIFTYTVLDAMSNREVYSFDHKLSINEIAEYSKYLLPKIAKDKFVHKQNVTVYFNGDTTFAVGGLGDNANDLRN